MGKGDEETRTETIESLAQSVPQPQMSGSDQQTEPSKFEVGSTAWFAVVIGIKNWGLHPLKDLHHVTDEDLVQIFGGKVEHKGYSYRECKSAYLKSKIIELYPAFSQMKDMPNFIPQSFARAVVSEALHYSIIDWAKLALEKWRGKSSWRKPPIILQEGGGSRAYNEVVLEKLTKEISLDEKNRMDLENLRAEAEKKVMTFEMRSQQIQ